MKQSTLRRFTSVCVVSAVVAVGALVSAPANAATPSTTPLETLAEPQVDALAAGIDQSNHTFDGKVALSAGATPGVVSQFAAGYRAGGGQITNAVPDAAEYARLRAINISACGGKNSFDVTGLQANLYLNSCKSDEIQKGLVAGAGVAALIGTVTAASGGGAAAAGIAAAGLSLGAGLIGFYNRGKGICIYGNPLVVNMRSQ